MWQTLFCDSGFHRCVRYRMSMSNALVPIDLMPDGVTRLPANVVGAIDIDEDRTLVDVRTEHAELVTTKLAGIRVKNQSLKLAIVPHGGS